MRSYEEKNLTWLEKLKKFYQFSYVPLKSRYIGIIRF